jgi:transposase
VTLIRAIDRHGLLIPLIFRVATGMLPRKDFVKEILLPCLKAGSCVICNNLSFHKTRAVQELFAESGIELLFMSPYLPNLNPIEIVR